MPPSRGSHRVPGARQDGAILSEMCLQLGKLCLPPPVCRGCGGVLGCSVPCMAMSTRWHFHQNQQELLYVKVCDGGAAGAGTTLSQLKLWL